MLPDGEEPPRELFKEFEMRIVFEEIQADAPRMDGDGGGDGNPMEAKCFDGNGMPFFWQETNFEILD